MSELQPTRPHGGLGAAFRIEAFSDAVFALATALLLLSEKIPESYHELMRHIRGFAAFGVTFAILLMIWWMHHEFFKRYHLADVGTTAWNGLLLFLVLFYVYPMKFIWALFIGGWISQGRLYTLPPDAADGIDLGMLFLIYGLGFAGVFFCFVMLYRRAMKTLALTGADRLEARLAIEYHLCFVGVGIASASIALTGVGLRWGLPGWIYALIGTLCAMHGASAGKRRRAIKAT